MSTILVTGGAGYIGSHTVRALANLNYKVIVLDNLVYGHKEAIINSEVRFIEGDIANKSLVKDIIETYKVDAVIHFAAYAYVGESVTDPTKYYNNNLASSILLLDAMHEAGCKNIIFSSTCASYGTPKYIPIDESHPQDPINPYGASKWMLERVIKDYHHAYGINYAFLRYFNASGCSADGLIGEDHNPEPHLIPLILKAVKGERDAITVFGTDYETPDGTCVRDYIHVEDLADAHIKAFAYLLSGKGPVICNLGTGIGYSVKEMIEATERVTGKSVPVVYGDRREGDPSHLVSNPAKALSELGWKATYTNIEDIIATAWKWENGARKGRYSK
jgi:UDP-glucose 4-epimerase